MMIKYGNSPEYFKEKKCKRGIHYIRSSINRDNLERISTNIGRDRIIKLSQNEKNGDEK